MPQSRSKSKKSKKTQLVRPKTERTGRFTSFIPAAWCSLYENKINCQKNIYIQLHVYITMARREKWSMVTRNDTEMYLDRWPRSLLIPKSIRVNRLQNSYQRRTEFCCAGHWQVTRSLVGCQSSLAGSLCAISRLWSLTFLYLQALPYTSTRKTVVRCELSFLELQDRCTDRQTASSA